MKIGWISDESPCGGRNPDARRQSQTELANRDRFIKVVSLYPRSVLIVSSFHFSCNAVGVSLCVHWVVVVCSLYSHRILILF